jgi:hypothetical protein
VSEAPERIRESAHETYERIELTIECIKEAYKDAVNLFEEVDSNGQVETANEVEATFAYLTRAIGHLNEASHHHKEYERTANALKAEAAKSSSDDLDQLVEQVKAAMAGAGPGTDVVFVVRKEADPITFKMSELEGELSKRFAGFEERKWLLR